MASQTDNLLICNTCGAQFDISDRSKLTRCNICDDPRQYVPSSGQSFTTLLDLKKSGHQNKWKPLDGDERFWTIWTEPKFAIGQRAILIKSPSGNVLWDCITFLDAETVEWIKSQGGLAAIVISHPHFYSAHLEWAAAFGCPVYLSGEDKEWLNRSDSQQARKFIETNVQDIQGFTAIKLGGHFPGSLVLLAFGRLLTADTLMTTPSGVGDWTKGPDGKEGRRPEGMNSFSFMWSIPNMIPLSAEEIVRMWNLLNKFEFSSTHGAFAGAEVYDGSGGSGKEVKRRVFESMQIQIKRMGWENHSFLVENW